LPAHRRHLATLAISRSLQARFTQPRPAAVAHGRQLRGELKFFATHLRAPKIERILSFSFSWFLMYSRIIASSRPTVETGQVAEHFAQVLPELLGLEQLGLWK
jgi:hypothetical protein